MPTRSEDGAILDSALDTFRRAAPRRRRCRVSAATQTKSFELHRNGLSNVQDVTSDEVFAKITIVVALLEGRAATSDLPTTMAAPDTAAVPR